MEYESSNVHQQSLWFNHLLNQTAGAMHTALQELYARCRQHVLDALAEAGVDNNTMRREGPLLIGRAWAQSMGDVAAWSSGVVRKRLVALETQCPSLKDDYESTMSVAISRLMEEYGITVEIDIDLPTLEAFVHQYYIQVAKAVYDRADLFYPKMQGTSAVQREVRLLVGNALSETILGLLPYQQVNAAVKRTQKVTAALDDIARVGPSPARSAVSGIGGGGGGGRPAAAAVAAASSGKTGVGGGSMPDMGDLRALERHAPDPDDDDDGAGDAGPEDENYEEEGDEYAAAADNGEENGGRAAGNGADDEDDDDNDDEEGSGGGGDDEEEDDDVVLPEDSASQANMPRPTRVHQQRALSGGPRKAFSREQIIQRAVVAPSELGAATPYEPRLPTKLKGKSRQYGRGYDESSGDGPAERVASVVHPARTLARTMVHRAAASGVGRGGDAKRVNVPAAAATTGHSSSSSAPRQRAHGEATQQPQRKQRQHQRS